MAAKWFNSLDTNSSCVLFTLSNFRNSLTHLTVKNTHNTWDLKRTGHELLTKLSYRVSDELPPAKITLVGIFVEITQILANCDFSLYVPCSQSSRPEYYSILDPFVQSTLTDFMLKCVIIITSKSEFLWKSCYCGYGKW